MMTAEEMEQVSRGLDVTAAKVRKLYEAGAGVGEIRRFLGISYQHAYNVLLRAGAIQKKSERPEEAELLSGGDEVLVARTDASGAIHFAPEIMEEFGIRANEEVYGRRSHEGLLLIGRTAALEAITRMAKAKMPDQASLLEALLKGSNKTT